MFATIAQGSYVFGQAQAFGPQRESKLETDMKLNRFLTATALAATLAVTPFVATQTMAQAQVDGAEVVADDSKIDAFIQAALSVAETRQGYLSQLEATTDEAQQMEIVQAADAAILQVVEDAPDITVEEYIAIGEAAASDPELAARIDARFAEAHADG